jgi:hypothetical protein
MSREKRGFLMSDGKFSAFPYPPLKTAGKATLQIAEWFSCFNACRCWEGLGAFLRWKTPARRGGRRLAGVLLCHLAITFGWFSLLQPDAPSTSYAEEPNIGSNPRCYLATIQVVLVALRQLAAAGSSVFCLARNLQWTRSRELTA